MQSIVILMPLTLNIASKFTICYQGSNLHIA